jgi:hypothetical protein
MTAMISPGSEAVLVSSIVLKVPSAAPWMPAEPPFGAPHSGIGRDCLWLRGNFRAASAPARRHQAKRQRRPAVSTPNNAGVRA